MAGLPVSRVINVTVNLSPNPTTQANLNTMMIVGSSDIIDVVTRYRTYTSLTAVGADFGTSAAEYGAAAVYFGQNPQPTSLYIGKWAQTATAGRVVGASLTATQQAITNFNTITNGGFKVQVDAGALTNVTGISLTGVTTLNGIASAINTALTSAAVGATAAWDGTRFTIKSNTTGATSAVTTTVAPTTGTDLGPLIGTNAASLPTVANGIVAESAVTAITKLDTAVAFYGFAFAPTMTDADLLTLALFAQGSVHLLFLTSGAAAILDPTSTTDLFYLLKASAYTRTVAQYSSASPYAAVSLAARALGVDYTQPNTTITLAFKQEPGVTAENLTAAQANALEAKNGNVFVGYQNGNNIVEPGITSGGNYIDEMTGTDQLALTAQTELFTILYTTPKIPQTDQGNGILAAGLTRVLARFVTNGFIAAGLPWNGGGVGTVKTGDTLATGFYVYQPPVATQSTADRAARKSVPFTVLCTLAGAVQSANVVISVQR